MNIISPKEKNIIITNLVDILVNDVTPKYITRLFIENWKDPLGTNFKKQYSEMWKEVLRNFYPKSRPVLFSNIISKSKRQYITSFRSTPIADKGYLIICDTRNTLLSEEPKENKGNYRYTFYPLHEVLQKAQQNGGWGFSDSFLNNYCQQEDYIMEIDYSKMLLLKFT